MRNVDVTSDTTFSPTYRFCWSKYNIPKSMPALKYIYIQLCMFLIIIYFPRESFSALHNFSDY